MSARSEPEFEGENRAGRGTATFEILSFPCFAAVEAGVPASISERIQAAAMEQYQIGSGELALQIPKLRKLIDTDIRNLEKQLDAAGAPPTPGRLPDWKGGK